jgi:hypothetical protein
MVEEGAAMVGVQARGVVAAAVVVGMMDPACGVGDMGEKEREDRRIDTVEGDAS